MRGSDLVRVCARTPEEGDGLDQGEGAHLDAKERTARLNVQTALLGDGEYFRCLGGRALVTGT